jgi:hypothetical protein
MLNAQEQDDTKGVQKLKLFAQIDQIDRLEGKTETETHETHETHAHETETESRRHTSHISIDTSVPLHELDAPISPSPALDNIGSMGSIDIGNIGTGNYEVIWKKGELLGKGSFGCVFSGINLSTGERIAVKEVSLRRGKKHRAQAHALQQEVSTLITLLFCYFVALLIC